MPEPDENAAKVVVGLRCAACDSDFFGSFPTEFADRLGAAGVTAEEVVAAIRRGLLGGQIMCRSCLRARTN